MMLLSLFQPYQSTQQALSTYTIDRPDFCLVPYPTASLTIYPQIYAFQEILPSNFCP